MENVEETETLVGQDLIAKLHMLFLRLLYTEAVRVQYRSQNDERCIQSNMQKYHNSLYKIVQVCWHPNWQHKFQKCLSLLDLSHRSQDRRCKANERVTGSEIPKACKMDFN